MGFQGGEFGLLISNLHVLLLFGLISLLGNSETWLVFYFALKKNLL